MDSNLVEKLKRIRFFGHSENKDIVEDGINGKMTEIHAALGIANLKNYDKVLDDRKFKFKLYLNKLTKIDSLRFQKVNLGESNYSYFPVIFSTENDTLDIMAELERENIFPRRYFYPSTNTFRKIVDYQRCEISEDISKRILCLPLYYDLRESTINTICDIIINYFNN